jgi:hypothetical protein
MFTCENKRALRQRKFMRSDRTSAIPIDEGQPFEFYE